MENLPDFFTKSIYLAGTNTKQFVGSKLRNWREDALELLEEFGYDGVVIIPEDNPEGSYHFPSSIDEKPQYLEQITWEQKWLNSVDAIVCWLPRSIPDNIGLASNVEVARYLTSGKLFAGSYPVGKDSDRNNYLKTIFQIENIVWYTELRECIKAALNFVGSGSTRTGTEREIPLKIWQHPSFKKWKTKLDSDFLDCELQSIKILYSFTASESKELFFWIAQPKILINKEDKRVKDNEFVVGRTDLCTTVVYTNDVDKLEDVSVVLVKEFRTATSGYVYEFPSGSVENASKDYASHALREFAEETGIEFDEPEKITVEEVGNLQCVSTLSAHKNHVYKIGVSSEVMQEIIDLTKGKTFGVEEDTERTYVEVKTIKEILDNSLLDWSMFGVLAKALFSITK